ncbi:hypothetical protein PF010_g31881 [Phytophthora fragariae]|uniref:Uncharacterized protein n=1 Tax=Phytophthora fragariae TaxID=53985 RepID=A0A6G0JG31_9STRA|nr:hypothetical protein PF010_g31881 [Phytophthora fragariae]
MQWLKARSPGKGENYQTQNTVLRLPVVHRLSSSLRRLARLAARTTVAESFSLTCVSTIVHRNKRMHASSLHSARVVAQLGGNRERLACALQFRIVDPDACLLEDVHHLTSDLGVVEQEGYIAARGRTAEREARPS